jgi:hypothetical protein
MSSESPLADLLAYIAAAQAVRNSASPGSNASNGQGINTAELPAIDYFRRTWSRVSTNQLLRQSQEHVPDNAGPLNSSHLVHRALSQMRALSPDYLHHLVTYVDALSWIEQMKNGSTQGGGSKGGKALRRAGTLKKSSGGRQR